VENTMRGKFWTAAGVGALAVIAIAAVVALSVVYSGAYNVAATEQHASLSGDTTN
jgi:hypothetical protein